MLVKDIHAATASSHPMSLVTLAGNLFFVTNDGDTGYEIWRSDGTENGTQLIKDINPGPANAFIEPFCREEGPGCPYHDERYRLIAAVNNALHGCT